MLGWGLFIFVLLPIVIPIIILLILRRLYNNKIIKNNALSILGIMYNGIVAFISPLLLLCLLFLLSYFGSSKIVFMIIAFIFAIMIVPLNIFIIKKGKMNTILYIIINVILFAVIFMFALNKMRGNIDL